VENLGSGTVRKLGDDLIITNLPGKLLILIPADLEEGISRLKVVTQFTGGGKLLNVPRESVFGQELIVI
jgi:hypothetical protein